MSSDYAYSYTSTRTPPPYILEDRTGQITATDFDDLYDRVFFRIARIPRTVVALAGASERLAGTRTMIYRMNIRGSRYRDSLPFTQQPVVILDFAPGERLGNITFVRRAKEGEGEEEGSMVVPMHRYLRKTSLFGSSLLRKFTGSDGEEYVWSHCVVEGHEWSCTTVDNVTAAHFELKPPDKQSYDPLVSGNYLTIYQPFFHMALELVASLTIMRHIAQYNL